MQNHLLRPRIRVIITGILTIAVGISSAVLGNWDSNQNYYALKIISFFAASATQILYLVLCAAQEVKEKLLLSEYKRQLTAYETALSGITCISQSNASDLNTCIHHFEENHNISNDVWNYKKVCYQLCQVIYNFACKLTDNQECEVAYVKLNEQVDGEISMFAYANFNNQTPVLLNEKRNFKDQTSSQIQYYDMHLFQENINQTKILFGSDKINNLFYRTPEEREKFPNKYNQFIGIPVFCDDQKMVGLLEISFLNNCSLGKNDEVIRDIANRYFVPFSNLFLLLHKTNKALHLGIN